MKAIFILIATIIFAIVPFLSPDFGGFDPERFPIPQRNAAIQPAGWAFSIWALIYLWLIAHAVFGVFKYREDAEWDRGRVALFISLSVGATWLPVALLSPIWATVLIWIMLGAALMAAYQSDRAAPAWIARWPIALYAGWLSAASFVSIGLLLAGYGFFEENTAAVIALVLATGFAGYNAYRLRSLLYGAAAAWGLFAIGISNLGSSMLLSIAPIVAAILVFGLSALNRIKQR
ncbi:MAG: hypothetical protein AB8B54_03640 [Sphingorhabdus sp.]